MPAFATYPSLRGRVALVTGGASGIGEAIVQALAAQGTDVTFLDIQDDAAHALIERLRDAGHTPPTYRRCDLTDTASLLETVAAILTDRPTVHILVNNAGDDSRHTLDDVTSDSFDQAVAVNLKHFVFTTQALVPALRRSGAGSVINLSSIAWQIPSTGLPIYVAAKAAVVGLTRALAHELGPTGVRVNAVLPGAILTERQQRLWLTDAYRAEVLSSQALKRLIHPEEVARLVLFLASDDSSAITNQSHTVDAGWT